MNNSDVIALLKAHENERGIKHWNERYATESKLKSFGIGLTQLRKLSKQLGKDHELAISLWDTDIYDARVIALLIDDPKLMTRDQIENQVDRLTGGHLAHVFSTCGATLAKTTFARDVTDDWMSSDDPIRRRCAYGLLYEFSKSKKKDAPDNHYFLAAIDHIDQEFNKQDINVQMAMGGAIMGIGMRNLQLHAPALKLAQKIGPIDFDPTGKCDPFDAVKHLTGATAKKKLGL